MTDELRVLPDDEGNCPQDYHKMPADEQHDTEWCMEGESHPQETYSNDNRKGMETKETRQTHDITLAEIRDDSGDATDSPKIVGYAAVYDSLSSDLGGFREKIDRGAFAESLRNNDEVHALFNHDDNKILGRRGSGTLRLWEDDDGLKVEIDPPNTPDGNDVVELLRRGDLVSMSFGFYNTKDTWETRDGEDIRTIESATLFDVSVVANPAYDATTVGVRNDIALRSQGAYHENIVEETDMDAVGETIDLRLRLRLAEEG